MREMAGWAKAHASVFSGRFDHGIDFRGAGALGDALALQGEGLARLGQRGEIRRRHPDLALGTVEQRAIAVHLYRRGLDDVGLIGARPARDGARWRAGGKDEEGGEEKMSAHRREGSAMWGGGQHTGSVHIASLDVSPRAKRHCIPNDVRVLI